MPRLTGIRAPIVPAALQNDAGIVGAAMATAAASLAVRRLSGPDAGRTREQGARERLARVRAEQARSRRRRLWLIVTRAAVVVIAAAVGITLAVTSGESSGGPGSRWPR